MPLLFLSFDFVSPFSKSGGTIELLQAGWVRGLQCGGEDLVGDVPAWRDCREMSEAETGHS